jgi:hypothetical protein
MDFTENNFFGPQQDNYSEKRIIIQQSNKFKKGG